MTKFILRWAINAIALYLAVLILLQPDLGTSLVFAGILVSLSVTAS